jgi:hypothetical protein
VQANSKEIRRRHINDKGDKVTENTEEVFKSMNASRILVSILETLGSVTVSTETFLKANAEDRELNVEYDDEKLSFIFKIKENNE